MYCQLWSLSSISLHSSFGIDPSTIPAPVKTLKTRPDNKPDLILSGINHGPNLGTDIFCSGTVAAAMEGTLENVPSMAISVASFKWKNFEFAGEIAMNIAEQAINDIWPASLLLNLNFIRNINSLIHYDPFALLNHNRIINTLMK